MKKIVTPRQKQQRVAPKTVAAALECEPNEGDRDPSNVMVRAGYLRGLAEKLAPGRDRTFLVRASRSLIAYAQHLRSEKHQ